VDGEFDGYIRDQKYTSPALQQNAKQDFKFDIHGSVHRSMTK